MAPEEEVYRIPTGRRESMRLTHQHFLWKDLFGWNLHPTISESWKGIEQTKQERRIADVGCGNGIWIVDESSAPIYHQVRTSFTGFDKSKFHWPPEKTWPSNIRFEVWDIRKPPAEKFRGYFDVVSVRLLLSALKKAQILSTLENFMMLLKPGGWIQWGDANFGPTGKICPMKGSIPTDSIWHEFPHTVTKALNPEYDFSWSHDLTVCFNEAGLKDSKRCPGGLPRKEMLRYWSENESEIMSVFVNVAAADMKDDQAKRELLRLWSRAEQERVEGISTPYFEVVWCIGRKAIESE